MYPSYYEGFVKVKDYLNQGEYFARDRAILSHKEMSPEYIGVSIAGRPDSCFKGLPVLEF